MQVRHGGDAVGNVEYYHAALDHYFVSALAADIDALDSGRIGGWTRTGLSFHVFPSQAAGGAGVSPVCRILIRRRATPTSSPLPAGVRGHAGEVPP